jgi:tetratricopeptide (TPR) repeat protein
MGVQYVEIRGLLHVWEALSAFVWPKLRLVTVLLFATNWFATYLLFAQTTDEAARRIQGLIQKGDLETARKDVVEAIKAAPKNASLYNLQGVVLVHQSDTSGAEKSFKTAIELSPSYPGAYANLGHLYQLASKNDPDAGRKALEVYERLLKFDPSNPDAIYEAAVLLFQMGSFRNSLEHLSRLPKQDQERAPVLSLLCGDFAGQAEDGRAADAANDLLRSVDLAEVDVLNILPVLANIKNQALAVKLLEQLEAKGLAGFESLQALGSAYRRNGKLDSARSTLEKAAELQPNSAPVLVSLAEVADQQHDNLGALEYLAHARDLDPKNAAIHFFWGIVCIEQNLGMEAYQSLKKAISLDPENAYYNYALGAVAMQFVNAGESVAYLQKYCQLRPEDPRGRLALGTAYFGSHDDEKAQKLLASVIQYPETAATAHYYLGRIASQGGDFDKAIRELGASLQALPDYADAYAELGLIHMKRNEYPQAREALQRALMANPDSYTANLDLLILYRRTKDPRVEEQEKRFEKVKKATAQRTAENLRAIEVQPVYSTN